MTLCRIPVVSGETVDQGGVAAGHGRRGREVERGGRAGGHIDRRYAEQLRDSAAGRRLEGIHPHRGGDRLLHRRQDLGMQWQAAKARGRADSVQHGRNAELLVHTHVRTSLIAPAPFLR